MELDKNGDPAMAYMVIDPNGDGDESDDTLYFVSWNRGAYAWNKPVAVAVTGLEFSEGPTVLLVWRGMPRRIPGVWPTVRQPPMGIPR